MEKMEGVDEKSDINNIGRRAYSRKRNVSLSFLVSHKSPIILRRATRKTHPSAYRCI